MTEGDPGALPAGESWDNYWRDGEHGAAYSSRGISHPTIESFWDEFFGAVREKYDTPRIIDIASGSGAVVECATSAFGGQLPDFTCLDVSASAIKTLEQRFPGVHTIVADAGRMPLESAGYDIATSQFGIEYAGIEAINEVARLIVTGGQLAVLLHHRSGSIFRECAASLDAIQRVQQSGFVAYSIAMFEKGFAAVRGADRAEYEAAGKQLAPAVRELEAIMTEHGKHVAGDTVMRLYNDVGTIHERIQHYDPSEVLNWLNNMEGELQAFAARMASMCDAAIGSDTFDRLCDGLREQGFVLTRADALTESEQRPPIAWALIAIRS